MNIEWNAIALIAAQEARIQIRSRWTGGFAVIFAALSLAISYFGLVTAGSAGFQGFERTTVSLLNLILYLAPLVGLVMATLSMTGDSGARELLFSQPVSRGEILLGKVAGLFAAMSVAMLAGFGLTGLVIASRVDTQGIFRFALFVTLSLVLSLVFVVLGTLVAATARSRTKAFALALFTWFFFVLFYDLLVIGVSFLLREKTANQLVLAALFGNPVDLVRVASLLSLNDPTLFGPAGAVLMKFVGGVKTGSVLLAAALAEWVAAPAFLAAWILRRSDL